MKGFPSVPFHPPSSKGGRGGFILLSLLLLPISFLSCQKVEADRLYAVRLEQAPTAANWETGVPLELKAGGGNIHGEGLPLTGLDPETDPVHKASASCHHGPPVTNPVFLEARAYYDEKNLHVEVRWEDPTEDATPRRWERSEGEWNVTDDEGDGLAIIWSRYPAEFGCQEACHVEDWTVRGGSLVDVRHMYLPGKNAWEEAWVWKTGVGGRELILGDSGFLTPDGERYREVNSSIARDPSLGAEIRRARTFGGGDAPAVLAGEDGNSAPAYLWGKEPERPLLRVRSERLQGGWRVVFSRPLDAGEGRQSFRPGEEYRFGVAVFDNTTLDHHIVRDAQVFTLVVPRSR